MKFLATTIACSVALVAVSSAAAQELPGANLISEIADEYVAESEEHDGLSIIFEEKKTRLNSCNSAAAKLEKCTAKAAGKDPNFQQSIMTTGSKARACLLEAKNGRQQDECIKPFMKLLESKCHKATLDMINKKCKVYTQNELGDEFELIIERKVAGGPENEEDSVGEEGVLDVDENFMSLKCKFDLMKLEDCVKNISKKDKTLRSTVETAASSEKICLQFATKKSDKKECTKKLKAILMKKCPKQTRQVLKACNIKTGELRATI